MASLRIEFAPVYVSDQQRALEFYTQQLGFEVRQDDTMPGDLRWLTVALPGRETGILLASGRGVEFTEAPTMQPWGLMQAQFADPDGNVFVVTQPGE